MEDGRGGYEGKLKKKSIDEIREWERTPMHVWLHTHIPKGELSYFKPHRFELGVYIDTLRVKICFLSLFEKKNKKRITR